MVINYVEQYVENTLHNILTNDNSYNDICRCTQCIEDIKAMALNNLKPFYVTTKMGEVYGEYRALEVQYSAEIIKEVVNAIEFVSLNKRH